MYRPKEIAERLAISPATLRLWSNEFADFLSPAAQKTTTEQGTAAQRRYDDSDLATFTRAKELLAGGATYEEVRRRLSEDPPQVEERAPSVPLANGSDPAIPTATIALTLDDHPIVRAFRDALDAKDETIRSKDATIDTLHLALRSKDEQLHTLRDQLEQATRPVPALAPPVRFRWGFLNRFLLDSPAPDDTVRSGS